MRPKNTYRSWNTIKLGLMQRWGLDRLQHQAWQCSIGSFTTMGRSIVLKMYLQCEILFEKKAPTITRLFLLLLNLNCYYLLYRSHCPSCGTFIRRAFLPDFKIRIQLASYTRSDMTLSTRQKQFVLLESVTQFWDKNLKKSLNSSGSISMLPANMLWRWG